MIHRRPLVAVAFMAPALALYLAIIVYPLVQGLVLSTTDSKIGNAGNFVGAANYARTGKRRRRDASTGRHGRVRGRRGRRTECDRSGPRQGSVHAPAYPPTGQHAHSRSRL